MPPAGSVRCCVAATLAQTARSKPARKILDFIFSTFTVRCGNLQAVRAKLNLVKLLRRDTLWV
jgi:hypothetical protein